MALMLKTETAISIAIRHYTNSIYTNIKQIDEESSKLNYKYLNEMIAPFNTEVTSIQNTLIALNNVVGDRGTTYTEQKLIEIDAKIKEACLALIKKIQTKQSELKIFASKFDDLLLAILMFAKRDVSTFIQISMDNKSKKVEELNGVQTPTLGVVSSVLRLPELHSESLYQEVKDEAIYKARRNVDRYDKDSDISDFVETYVFPSVSDLSLEKIQTAVKRVIVLNEDGDMFIQVKLPQTNKKYWDRNKKKLERDIQAYMDEMV